MLAWLGAAAISIPIIIHLMSRFRRKPEPWGAMRFLIEAYRKQRKRLQIEKLLLLLVRCMVVLLAGLALAGPVLGGCKSGSMSFGGSSGRVVYIVIDDALSSQTREAGTTRLEQHKLQALEVIDEMGADDRAVLVRMARPTKTALDEPTSDTDALRQAVEEIQPRNSRGELLGALSLVQQSMDEAGVRDGDAVVVLLSDFPGSADYFDKPLPPEIEGLGRRVTMVTALPPTGTDNLQVMSLEPRRRMVVAESTGSTVVGGRVVLRRFGGIAQPRKVELRIQIETAEGETLAQTTRDVTWPAGEREQGVNFDLPVVLAEDELDRGGQELIIRAQLLADAKAAGLDVLSADDQATAVVRLRNRLQVALIDSEEAINPNLGEFEPWQYVRSVLTPDGAGGGGSFELSPLLPTTLNADAIDSFDAAIVLRPDELTKRGWDTLNRFAKSGGLVWVFTPALDTQPDWAEAMKRSFDLRWTFGEALVLYEPAEAGDKAAATVDQTTSPPIQLQYLAADWREQLGWIKVGSWLPLTTEPESRWIVLDTTDPALPASDKPVLMAHRAVGRGTLVFTATPLDTRFTNMPIRPFNVALMHDTLRGVLGSTIGDGALTAGDQPVLDASWRGVGELALPTSAEVEKENASILAQREDEGVRLTKPVDTPGVYSGTVSGSPRLLAVNIDSDAGDTFGGQGALEVLLDSLGGWSYLKDSQQAGGVLAQSQSGADLTKALLWALLALVLLETLLARWFSHATDREGPTIVGRVLGALHGEPTAKRTTGGGG